MAKFFGLMESAAPTRMPNQAPRGVSLEMLHQMECKACPLNRAKCRSPKMKPEGSSQPRIYVLGTAPNDAADDIDRPWAGADAKLVKRNMTRDAFDATRWNNVVRTFPGMDEKAVDTRDKDGNKLYRVKDPNYAMIEACRPSIIKDIEESAPEAIFTFGSPALKWVNGETHPSFWMGRRMPVKVGKHTCWLYPFPHPIDIMKGRRWEGFQGDDEQAFKFYLKRACDEVMGSYRFVTGALKLPKPYVHSEELARRDVECFDGSGGESELDTIERILMQTNPQYTEHGFDIETNKLRPYNKDAKLLSFGVSVADWSTIAVAVEHREAKWTPNQRKRLLDILYRYLMRKGITKAVHQLAFELEWMAVFLGRDIVWGADWDDTIGQAFVLNETQGMLALENLTMQYFGFNIKALSDVNRKNLENEPLAKVLTYQGMDAKYHRELFLVQKQRLIEDGTMEFYEHFKLRPRALVLSQMRGVPVAQDRVREYREEFEPAMKKAEAELAKLPEVAAFRRKYGEDYSPSNTNHLAKILRLAGYKLSKTAGGGDATDVKNLKGIDHPVIAPTIVHRKAAKVLSTYMDAVTEGHDKSAIYEDGLIHAIISATKVTTSRTSSDSPNLQNWPKRNENRKVRRVVKAKSGYKIVSVDYAGIQGRNVAMESKDKRLVDAFIHNYDIHTDWLTKLNEIFPRWAGASTWKDKKLIKDARNAVKNQFVFPTFFGARPSEKMAKGLMNVYGHEMPEPKHLAELQDMFFADFPEIKDWHEQLRADYHELGYVTGLSGHRRHAPVEYTQLINAPIQADEAIIVLSAHIALTQIDPIRYAPCMEIHDDLTWHLSEKNFDESIDVILKEMTRVRFDWINPVPLEVELSIGDDWAAQEVIGAYKNKYTDGSAGYVEIKK